MQTITNIIGFATDQSITDRLHDLSHAGCVEVLTLDREDMPRRRLRATTDHGTDCVIALPRDQKLEDGAVLRLDEGNAIVVRMSEERWLSIKPANTSVALELGYFAGNLHWRVRFKGGLISVAVEGPIEFYLERLKPFVDSARAEIVSDG